MSFTRRTAQLLHEDHRATLTMVEALEGLIVEAKRTPPDTGNPHVQNILKQTIANISQEIGGHFSFEEDQLFTRLAEFGDEAIGEHLREEHQAMLAIAQQVVDLASTALATGFDNQNWLLFKTFAGELSERMFTHIQKEEMALLPMLEELLDPETDMELAELFSQGQ